MRIPIKFKEWIRMLEVKIISILVHVKGIYCLYLNRSQKVLVANYAFGHTLDPVRFRFVVHIVIFPSLLFALHSVKILVHLSFKYLLCIFRSFCVTFLQHLFHRFQQTLPYIIAVNVIWLSCFAIRTHTQTLAPNEREIERSREQRIKKIVWIRNTHKSITNSK